MVAELSALLLKSLEQEPCFPISAVLNPTGRRKGMALHLC